jgi:hypothetical protein
MFYIFFKEVILIMKSSNFLYVFIALVIFSAALKAQTVKITPIQPNGTLAAGSVKNPELREELLKRLAADQKIRMELNQKYQGSLPPEALKTITKLDQENTAWIKQTMEKHGWLGTGKVGMDGAQAAFILVQHAASDKEFQSQALELLEKAVNDGEAFPVQLAFLTDRVRIAQGKPQLYGTQTRVTKEGKFEVPPIEDEANVDKRREGVGLEPLADYIQKMGQRHDSSRKQ